MIISNTLPNATVPLDQTTANSNSTNSASSTGSGNLNSLASEDTFLQLFVAQLQNQDPLNPDEEDPTQMVSELAQFSQLEQLVNIGQNVQSIDQTITAASTSGSSPSGATSGSSSTGGNTAATSSTQL